jgi:hypothetical protein
MSAPVRRKPRRWSPLPRSGFAAWLLCGFLLFQFGHLALHMLAAPSSSRPCVKGVCLQVSSQEQHDCQLCASPGAPPQPAFGSIEMLSVAASPGHLVPDLQPVRLLQRSRGLRAPPLIPA